MLGAGRQIAERMIISVSRRTDIPRYFSQWFVHRLIEGFCLVPNPFNPRQVSYVDLHPSAVTAFVFWSRFPQPFFPHLDRLDEMGYRYYFLITLNDYPKFVERHRPAFNEAVACFQALSARIGAGRLIWRYDPIFFTESMDADYHEINFRRIASALKGCCHSVIISFLTEYRKTMRNFAEHGIDYKGHSLPEKTMKKMLMALVDIAADNGLTITSCATAQDFSALGIQAGRCIDERLLAREFGIKVPYKKDPSQRQECRCTVSKDIGAYNTCLGDCIYCYAVSSAKAAHSHRLRHDPKYETLLK